MLSRARLLKHPPPASLPAPSSSSISSTLRPTLGPPLRPSQCRLISTYLRPFTLRIAIIGAGPAGFYTALRVLKTLSDTKIDMYEALPVPYGLVRFGVAPDHPEVKNCQTKFDELAQNPNFTYLGNLPIGDSPGQIPLSSIAPHYDALVLTYGASRGRTLGIPGEDKLTGIYSARDFVGWYNGLPEHRDLNPDLQAGEEAVIIGQGNVALDVARMLLSPVDLLRGTDITEYALEALAKSRVKRVRIVGRRGVLQASFTIKEIRELFSLPNTSFLPIPSKHLPPPELIRTFPRIQSRMLTLLHEHSVEAESSTPTHSDKSWSLDFLLSPTAFLSTSPASTSLSSIKFHHSALEPANPSSPHARISLLPKTTTLPASVAFRSIGYLSVPLPGLIHLGIPFNSRLGLVPNEGGRVVIPQRAGLGERFRQVRTIRVPGVYVAGWVKRGPTGVIASTMYDAFETGHAILDDWVVPSVKFMRYGGQQYGPKRGWEAIAGEARSRGARWVSWDEWKMIERAEMERGKKKGKRSEKFASVEEMLSVLK